MPRTLLDLNFDGTRPFDASGIGSVIRTSGPALRGNGSGASIDMEASSRVKVGRTESLDGVDAFTIAMSVNPEKLGRTQTLIDSQSPPIRLKVSSTGVLTGAVHTAAGWKTVSSRTKLKRGTDTKLRFVRDKSGNLKLEINGRLTGKGKAPGALVATGRSGVSVGTDIRGKVGLAGSISDLVILDSAVTSSTLRGLRRRANKIRARIRDLYAVDAAVYIDQADVDPRFNQIKAIMHAAGVDDLSQLADLTVSQRTTVVPGTILKAPPSHRDTAVELG